MRVRASDSWELPSSLDPGTSPHPRSLAAAMLNAPELLREPSRLLLSPYGLRPTDRDPYGPQRSL